MTGAFKGSPNALHCSRMQKREGSSRNVWMHSWSLSRAMIHSFNHMFMATAVFSFVPEFEFDIHGLEVKVAAGFSWGHWLFERDSRRRDWVLNPCDKDTLKEEVVDEILAIKREIEEDSSIEECERWFQIWHRLSDAAQDAIYADISEAEWRDSGRDKIRSSLIISISKVLDEEIEAWKEALDRIITGAEPPYQNGG